MIDCQRCLPHSLQCQMRRPDQCSLGHGQTCKASLSTASIDVKAVTAVVHLGHTEGRLQVCTAVHAAALHDREGVQRAGRDWHAAAATPKASMCSRHLHRWQLMGLPWCHVG